MLGRCTKRELNSEQEPGHGVKERTKLVSGDQMDRANRSVICSEEVV